MLLHFMLLLMSYHYFPKKTRITACVRPQFSRFNCRRSPFPPMPGLSMGSSQPATRDWFLSFGI